MNDVITHDYAPRPQFLGYHARDRRWSCIVAHRRAGKTVAVVNDTFARSIYTKKPNSRYAYIAPFYQQAKIIAWDYLKQATRGITTRVLESELSVTLQNNSVIRLFGADNPDSLRGIYLDGCVLDEFADMVPSIWGNVIRPLLSDRRGWATFIGTPKGHNAFYDVYLQSLRDPEWFSLVLKASETGLIPPEELADARRSMTDDQYRQEFECDFEAAIVGAYYGEQMRAADTEGRICAVPYDDRFEVHAYWDIGRRDETVIWFAQEVAREVRVLRVEADSGKDVAYYAELVDNMPFPVTRHYLPHDARAQTLASGRSVIEQLVNDHGLDCEIAPSLSVQDGIQAARLLLPRCVFSLEFCLMGIEAMKVYQKKWDDAAKCFRERPLHNWASNYADAFRIMALCIEPSEVTPSYKSKSTSRYYVPPQLTLDALWADQGSANRSQPIR